MSKEQKLLKKILSGACDNNIRFNDFSPLLDRLGFEMRISGSHHLYRKNGIEELINLQKDGNLAKPYQIKQLRNILLKYHFGEKDV